MQKNCTFLINQQIDIMLISETHFTNKSFLKIPDYVIYNTNHPNGTARGGSAVIIRKTIKHHEIDKHNQPYLQATSVIVEDWSGPITISAVYCPPKFVIQQYEFESFYKMLGNRFIAGGDYNAKHTQWGSRLTTTKGRVLFKTMTDTNLQYVSTGQPTTGQLTQPKLLI
jgi:exonuclease III